MGKESELYQLIRDKDVQGIQKLLKKDQRVKSSKFYSYPNWIM